MRKRFMIMAALLAATGSVYAEIYELPPAGHDVVGAVATITARYEDTLVDIARRHGLGYYDMVRANPGVDPWLPGEGTEVVTARPRRLTPVPVWSRC